MPTAAAARARGRRTRHWAVGNHEPARRRITARRSSGRVQRRGVGRRHAVESGREERRRARSYSDGPYFFTHAGVRPARSSAPKVVDRRTGELPQRPPNGASSSVTKIPSAADTSNARVASRTTFLRRHRPRRSRRRRHVLDGLENMKARQARRRRGPDRRPLSRPVPAAARTPASRSVFVPTCAPSSSTRGCRRPLARTAPTGIWRRLHAHWPRPTRRVAEAGPGGRVPNNDCICAIKNIPNSGPLSLSPAAGSSVPAVGEGRLDARAVDGHGRRSLRINRSGPARAR